MKFIRDGISGCGSSTADQIICSTFYPLSSITGPFITYFEAGSLGYKLVQTMRSSTWDVGGGLAKILKIGFLSNILGTDVCTKYVFQYLISSIIIDANLL